MNGSRQSIDSPGGLAPARRQRPGLTWIASLLAGLAILHATASGAETAAESAADTSEAVVWCPSTWTVCASSATPNPCYEGAPADSVGMYRYCTHGLDWECNFYMTGGCWYSSTPCAEADTTAPADDQESVPCLDFTEVIECGYFEDCAERDSTEPYRYCTTYEDDEGEVFRLHCTCSSTPCPEAGPRPATAVQAPEDSMPAQPRPGPGRPLVIPLDLADGERVHLALYNAVGHRVRQLWDGPLPAGSHRFVWDDRGKGRALAAGVYACKVEVGGQTIALETIRMAPSRGPGPRPNRR